ncbi:MAG: CehA/McbA family metallohydrolase [Gemmataceae bacterium]|nr:CehA/McbA family metallohydrolase [Gemmataceae bacterium]
MNRRVVLSRAVLRTAAKPLLLPVVGLLLGLGGAGRQEAAPAQEQTGRLTIKVSGPDKRALPCRVHLTDPAGKPCRAEKLPFWRDHFVCPGEAELTLAPGSYRFEIERGPEFDRRSGSVKVTAGGAAMLQVELKRIADLAAEGWYSGDLHVHRPPRDVPLLMQAEDLHIAPVITWWNDMNPWEKEKLPAELLSRFDGNRFYHVLAGEYERGGGALLFLNGRRVLPIKGSQREYPSSAKFLTLAGQEDCWIDIEKPFWWDVPLWLASGKAHSIGLANNHLWRRGMLDNEAWGRPRLRERFPAPAGNGLWSQEIYYHLLNCGIRLPPSAGSASGVLPNPVGYNRVYVSTGRELTWANWWQGLKAGRSFVTNGPLLLCTAAGKLPGHVFRAKAGEEVAVEVKVRLVANDPIRVLEIIRDGKVERRLPVRKTAFDGSVGKVAFKESGWFLVRAIADVPDTFRFASTAPFYVEVGDRRARVDRESARFFLDWVQERVRQLKGQLKDAEQLREVLAEHERAERFWAAKLREAVAQPGG